MDKEMDKEKESDSNPFDMLPVNLCECLECGAENRGRNGLLRDM